MYKLNIFIDLNFNTEKCVTIALFLKNNMLSDVMKIQSTWCNRGKNTLSSALLADTKENQNSKTKTDAKMKHPNLHLARQTYRGHNEQEDSPWEQSSK